MQRRTHGYTYRSTIDDKLPTLVRQLLFGATEKPASDTTDQAIRNTSLRNRIAAKMPITTKSAITTSCATKNGGSDCVGAIAFSAGTFMKSCAIKTKTFRYRAITDVIA